MNVIRLIAVLILLVSILLILGFVAAFLFTPETADKWADQLAKMISSCTGVHYQGRSALVLPFVTMIISLVLLFLTGDVMGDRPSRPPHAKPNRGEIDYSDRSVSQ